MVITRYKPLFAVSASYELTPSGTSTEGLSVLATAESSDTMKDLRLKAQHKKNIATVFYEGLEKPANVPTTCEPTLLIDKDQYFYFTLSLSDKERIKKLKFHSSDAVAKAIGFPLLYDAAITVLNGTADIAAREDVTIMPPVFTFTAIASDTGITASHATLEIRDEKNIQVDLEIPPAALNDKSIDGVDAVPEFAFSVDASKLQPGVYEFKTGSFTKKFFLATRMDITQAVSLVRVLKNNFLEYKKNLVDNSFAKFELLIPKV